MYLGAQSLQRIQKLFFHPTIKKNSSKYGQGCRRVVWSSWLPTSSLVLGWDILLEFSWVSATDILGYIRLLFPCWSVTWFASCAGAMVCVQTNRVSECYYTLIQPQSNSLYQDGAIYLDRLFFGVCFFERWQARMTTGQTEIGVTRLFFLCKE